MSEAKRIKDHYIKPPITMVETDYEKRRGGARFHVKTHIWIDQHLPEWRVAIPESTQLSAYCRERDPLETRFIIYVPTGRVVYDNTLPPAKAVIYEYILESLLGRKDLKVSK